MSANLTTITGDGGEVIIREDGTPIAWTPSAEVEAGEHDGYTSIARFDVEEWKAHYKRDTLPTTIDILDIGYWPDDAAYEPAEPDFRLPKTLNGYPVVKAQDHGNGYVTVMMERTSHVDAVKDWIVATWWPELKTSWSWGHYDLNAADAAMMWIAVTDRNDRRGA